jgi:hypothetical protein
MKTTLFLILFLKITCVFSQTQGKLQFSYDAAGNQTNRHYISVSKMKTINTKEIKNLTPENLMTAEQYKDIKYYPNPVNADLYIKWSNDTSQYVNSIVLYNMTGQEIKRIDNLEGFDSSSISFDQFPVGYYNLELLYSNGEKKTLKIIRN